MRLTSGRVREAREDADLAALALSQLWPLTADQKQALIDRQVQIATDPLVPVALQVMAAKNLLTASMVNLKAVDTLLKAKAIAVVNEAVSQEQDLGDEDIAKGLNRLITANDRKTDEPAGGNAGSIIPIESWKIDAG